MIHSRKSLLAFIVYASVLALPAITWGQAGSASAIRGTVQDSTGGVVPNATVKIDNPVSGYARTTTTDASGNFSFPNVPFNPYHLSVEAGKGFAPYTQDVELRSSVPVVVAISLKVGEATQTIEVTGEAADLIENDSTAHTDIDRGLFEKLPLESASSSVSSLVTLSAPGVAADSNGLFHGFGDHAQNSFSVDGQPITDQQSKVFSNQIPVDSIQSLEVIQGAPPAEYGDKTSLVIKATTRSGQGVTEPTGSITSSYGSFGTAGGGFNLAYGGEKWGNFISVDGVNSGRFLDGPEFSVIHDKGNLENAFDRVDYQFSNKDSVHLVLGFTHSWFQTPNTYDSILNTPESLGGFGHDVNGPTDQRSKIDTFNIAPSWTHVLNNESLVNANFWVRRDAYNYYPSDNPLADYNAIQDESVSQARNLTNVGGVTSYSYVQGINNIKAGVMYEQTFLNEHDYLGIVDPNYNVPGTATFNPILLPYDLTRGGTYYNFNGHTDVKELALYIQDAIIKGNWSFNVGLRGDFYNGLTVARQAEPRVGVAYNIKKTSTVLRVSYARSLETPFNENLILSSEGCASPVLAPLLLCSPGVSAPLSPGYRNEFHAGFEQAFSRYFVLDAEYLWKYTHNAYDFSVLGNTPITFPIEWHNSKIPGYAVRGSMPEFHGLTAFIVFSSVAARFFTPQVGGAGAVPSAPLGVFRIDHDEHFNQTTHLQYQPWKKLPWLGFNWRYDSGLVAGAVPCYGILPGNDCPASTTLGGQPAVLMDTLVNGVLVPLTADQEFEAGMYCGSIHATPTQALPSVCLASQFGSNLVKIPAPNTENDDHNPPRIAPRNLFDVAVGQDNLFRTEKYIWSLRVTAINIANEYALYNFLSTFSGTHYVSPRAITTELGFHF